MRKWKNMGKYAGAIVVVLLFFVSTTVLITTRQPAKGDPPYNKIMKGEPYTGWYVPGVEWKTTTPDIVGERNAVDASNNIYACGMDASNGKGVIQKLDPDGIVQWTTDFNIPTEMIDLSGGKGDGGKGMDPDEVEWFWNTFTENTRTATLMDIEVDSEQNIVACGTINDEDNHPLAIMAVKCTPDGEELWNESFTYFSPIGGVCLSTGLCLDGTAIYISGTFKINFGSNVYGRGGYIDLNPDNGDPLDPITPITFQTGLHPSGYSDVACDSTYLYCTGSYKPLFSNINIDALVSKFSKGGTFIHMATVDKQLYDGGSSIKKIGNKLFVAGFTQQVSLDDRVGLLIRASTGPSIELSARNLNIMWFTDLANRNDEQLVVSGTDHDFIYYYGATYAKSTLTEIQRLPLGQTEDGSDVLEGVSVDGNGDAIFSGGGSHLVVIKLDFAYTYVPPYGYE